MLFPFHQVRSQTLLGEADELEFIEGISFDLSNIQFCATDEKLLGWCFDC